MVDGLVSVTAFGMTYRNSLDSEPSGLETCFEVVSSFFRWALFVAIW